jgi:hypothetical protein
MNKLLIIAAFAALTACSNDKTAANISAFERDWNAVAQEIRQVEISIKGQVNYTTKCLGDMRTDSGYYYVGYTDSLRTIVDSLATDSRRGYFAAKENNELFTSLIQRWDKAHTDVAAAKQLLSKGENLSDEQSRSLQVADSLRLRFRPDLSRLRKMYSMQVYVSKAACEAYEVTLANTVYAKTQRGVLKKK